MGNKRRLSYNLFYVAGIVACLVILFSSLNNFSLNTLISSFNNKLHPLQSQNKEYEVFGFAPYWNINKLDNINFQVLSTFAYFGIEVDENGELIKDDPGYNTYFSEKATDLFKKSHAYGTRVVLTITMMDNDHITSLLDNKEAQDRAIAQTVDLVEQRGIDGINVDFEYVGDPEGDYKQKFSKFVENITAEMHKRNKYSKVTVSVYASSAKYPKIYDIASIAKSSDGIFMMAYDFATTGSEIAIPTAPLNGHKEGKYWYDISTAVEDFLAQMPADKLILGVPYYGYNYAVSEPNVKAETNPYQDSYAETYSETKDITGDVRSGWDDLGKVGWQAKLDEETGAWRMVFTEDEKSLALKYDFAKNKNLKGVGMWALGMDNGKKELWDLLGKKFGEKIADKRVGGQ